jgi:hypothetical protein
VAGVTDTATPNSGQKIAPWGRWPLSEWIAFSCVAVYFVWLVTHGTWQLLGAENYSEFFDQLARSIVRGRLDVPADAVGMEAFVIDGRYYGYWGPFPALLRLPLAIYGGHAWVGHTARLSSLIAGLITVLATRGIMDQLALWVGRPVLARWFVTALWLALALGSPLPFLLGRTYIYHESILWAGAMAQLALWAGLMVLRTRRPGMMWAMTMAAGSAALTRPTLGYGALLGTGLVLVLVLWQGWRERSWDWLGSRPRLKATGLIVLLALGGVLPFAYNYVRFGLATRMPMEKYLYASPGREEVTGQGRIVGQIFQLANLGPNLRAYLTPGQLGLDRRFPFFTTKAYETEPGQKLDNVEPHASLSVTMTGVLLLGVLGLAGFVQRPPLLTLVAGALATVVVICSCTGLSERYLQDFLPWLTLGAGMGAAMLAGRSGLPAGGLRALLTGLFLLSAVQFGAFAYTFQRLLAPATPDADKVAFEAFSDRVNDALVPLVRWLTVGSYPEVQVTDWQHLPPERAGQTVRRLSPPAVLRHDGQFWQLVEGSCDEIVKLDVEVTLPTADPRVNEPLLSIGRPGEATILILCNDGAGNLSAACDLYGRAFRVGPVFRPASRTFRLTLLLDRLNGLIRVSHEGRLLLDYRHLPHPVAGLAPFIGENPFGGSYAAAKAVSRVVRVEPAP